jgi:CRP-like cAMP-binding protein
MLQTSSSSAFVASPQLLEELAERSTPIALGEHRMLFREGDQPVGIYIVWRGAAVLTSGSNGETVLKVEAGPGSLLGVPAVVGSKRYSLTAVALEGAELSFINCEDFVHLMHTQPVLAFEVLKVLAEEVRFAREAVSRS